MFGNLFGSNSRNENAAREPAVNVLFVCMGNICRSPLAEGVFRELVERKGLSSRITSDSAGTHGHQCGEAPDTRAIRAAKLRGYDLASRRARRFELEDFGRFEWIMAMDSQNLRLLRSMRPESYGGHLGLILDFVPELGLRDVPDPYYGTPQDFEHVLDLVERGAASLLTAIEGTLGQEDKR